MKRMELTKKEDLIANIEGSSNLAICYNFVNHKYKLSYNVITGDIEDHNTIINGQYKIIGDREINTMYLKMSSGIAKNPPSKDFFWTFIQSEFVEMHNPFMSFFENNSNIERSQQLISDIASCIETNTMNAEKYIKHWGCGMIASIYGSQSPLTLVLVGEKLNTGKTEFFRRLLPDDLKQYYTESSLDGGKDDDILMCKKLIIMDDEFGGKNKKDQKRFKGLTSKQNMSIRIPYARTSREMRRICSLCGTSNELELLSDPYGNRRVLPIEVLSINHEKYNSINKTALLMAFYDLYKSGFHWKFKQEDIQDLNNDSDKFLAINYEAELIQMFFELPQDGSAGELMTNTQIKEYIEAYSKQKIFNISKFGVELKKLGFIQQKKNNQRVYRVVKSNVTTTSSVPQEPNKMTEQVKGDSPF